MDTRNQTLVNRLIGYAGVSPALFAALVAGVLALPLLVAWRTPGLWADVPKQGLWPLAMAPAMTAFILAAHPWLQRRWQVAIDALRPLSRQPEIVDHAFMGFDVGAWIALLLGAALAVWISLSIRIAGWLFVHVLVSHVVMFGLIAISIYDGLRRVRHVKRVVAAGLALDLFDRQSLTPLARYGQSASLTFIGGISLSLIFQSAVTLFSVVSLVTYAILVTAALTLFFTSVWSIHSALVAAQERELVALRQHWRRARADLQRQLDGSVGGAEDAARLYGPAVVFGTYERLVLDASTWPFDPRIVKQVAASLAAPVLIYGIKLAAGLSA